MRKPSLVLATSAGGVRLSGGAATGKSRSLENSVLNKVISVTTGSLGDGSGNLTSRLVLLESGGADGLGRLVEVLLGLGEELDVSVLVDNNTNSLLVGKTTLRLGVDTREVKGVARGDNSTGLVTLHSEAGVLLDKVPQKVVRNRGHC